MIRSRKLIRIKNRELITEKVNGVEYVQYANGRKVLKENYLKSKEKLAKHNPWNGKKRELSISKVKDNIEWFLREGEFLETYAPEKVLAEVGLEGKGKKVKWKAVIRLAMSAEVVGQHSPTCAKVLLEMDKFLFHKNQVKAEFAIKQRELELRQKTFDLTKERIKEMKKDKKAKKTQDEFIRPDNFGAIDV